MWIPEDSHQSVSWRTPYLNVTVPHFGSQLGGPSLNAEQMGGEPVQAIPQAQGHRPSSSRVDMGGDKEVERSGSV